MNHIHTFEEVTWLAAASGRWVARIAGLLMVLFLLAFAVGEGPPDVFRMTPREQVYLLGLLTLFGGLALAWFREGWGGFATVGAWGFLSVLAGRPIWDLPFLIPAVAGAVHIGCWWRLRSRPAPPLPFRVGMVLAAAVGLFALLAANEMFGQPPLLTPVPPLDRMTGTWTATSMQLAEVHIAGDGSVTGTFGDVDLAGGRVTGNRSWFGRWMHWRTDYAIRGPGYSMLLDESGGGMTLSGEWSTPGPQGRHQRVVLRKKAG